MHTPHRTLPAAASGKETPASGRYLPDELDLRILKMLMENANLPYTDIAKELNVSGGTIHVRMKKMQDAGVVLGSRLLVNASALGFDITAYLGIYLERASDYPHVARDMASIPEVVEMHYITGAYNIFCKIICKNTAHLRLVLNEKLQAIQGVQRTETFISLEENLHREIQIDLAE
jgi:Lrp/AsnC family transcriptional regulator, regulator for asnA, asnC and gidA